MKHLALTILAIVVMTTSLLAKEPTFSDISVSPGEASYSAQDDRHEIRFIMTASDKGLTYPGDKESEKYRCYFLQRLQSFERGLNNLLSSNHGAEAIEMKHTVLTGDSAKRNILGRKAWAHYAVIELSYEADEYLTVEAKGSRSVVIDGKHYSINARNGSSVIRKDEDGYWVQDFVVNAHTPGYSTYSDQKNQFKNEALFTQALLDVVNKLRNSLNSKGAQELSFDWKVLKQPADLSDDSSTLGYYGTLTIRHKASTAFDVTIKCMREAWVN